MCPVFFEIDQQHGKKERSPIINVPAQFKTFTYEVAETGKWNASKYSFVKKDEASDECNNVQYKTQKAELG